MSFCIKITSVLVILYCYGNYINVSYGDSSCESKENLNNTVQTNVSSEDEKVKIPLYNKDQVNIHYDDLMDILDKAPSPDEALENLTKMRKIKSPDSSMPKHALNPYFPSILPKLTYDEQKNLNIIVTCVRGERNRLIDAGEGKLIIQILAPDYDEAFEAEISRFLSSVLQVSRGDIFVTKGYGENERKVMVKAEALTHINPLFEILSVIEPPIERTF